MVLVFSVGGGNAEKNVSANIVEALKLAKTVGAKVIGVVGRDGGYTKQVADACVVVPTVNPGKSRRIPKPSRPWSGMEWSPIPSSSRTR